VVEPVETTVVMVCLCAEFSNGRFDASTSSATTSSTTTRNAFDRIYASGLVVEPVEITVVMVCLCAEF